MAPETGAEVVLRLDGITTTRAVVPAGFPAGRTYQTKFFRICLADADPIIND